MNIDPIHQRPGSAESWAGYNDTPAICQHKSRRKVPRHRRAGYADRSILERLAHDLQHVPGKLRKFIQEQHAIVGQRNFSRTQYPPPPISPRRVGCKSKPQGLEGKFTIASGSPSTI